ncbi:Bromodomain containing protein [Trichomonas vaginalis G3]|uniref:Bromodomain containing protein n=1 Tax=Trichomonas vaginalis (strain ATCC PRA-98 / G3) TaxID=412133 RepID=A2DAY6_TRIV3|nr:acetylation-dependent protein binding [Trichomonas vaginalis G3]EAY22316.1 Bromodomain containing protein [Trichomonas vaginalis G3]KAI5518254.1 acetylation-dependent protein binding [Trichomonas vaginalis G3]|eukprot:XP_001583302.1 Bromodomain containing protein [Trichomonas vaginalis G3]
MSFKFICSPLTVEGQSTKIIFKTAHVISGHTTTNLEKQAEYPEITVPEDKAFACSLTIIDKIIDDDCSIYFLRAVDKEIDSAPNYYEIITNPIDISMIRKNFLGKQYQKFANVVNDIKLLINNATQFNPKQHAVHQAALKMSFLLRDLLNTLNKNPSELEPNPTISKEAENRIAKAQSQLTEQRRKSRERHKKANDTPKKTPTKLAKRLLPREFEDLAKHVRELPSAALFGVLEIIQKGKFDPNNLPVEIDLQSLPDDVVDKVKIYVESCLSHQDKKPVMYAWQPYEPKELLALQEQYATELLTWKCPPKEAEIQREIEQDI